MTVKFYIRFLATWILGLALTCHTAIGQYVTIPDANFVNWLNNNGYVNCIIGNQMDTLCADSVLINNDSLDISYQGISDFTGIRFLQFFGGGSSPVINLSHNNLTRIQPEVSDKYGQLLQGTLILDYNQIDTLNFDSITPYLFVLSVQHNNMHLVISHVYPFRLWQVNLNDNNLDSLPYIWAPGNWQLYIRRNHLVKFPNLGNCIYIDVGVNLIDTIRFPPGGLTCDSNLLRHLDLNNVSNADINCSHNLLTTLTGLRGVNLLNCSFNQITRLDSINSMLSLVAGNNNLSAIGHFNTNLTLLDVSNNPLLQCIPNLPNVTNFQLDYANTAIACLPRQFPNCTYTGTPGINAVPTCNLFNNIYGCPQYSNTEGYGYFDTIPNCVMDTTEPRYPYVKAAFGANGNILQQTYTDWLGHYSFDEISYGTYQITVDTAGLPFSLTCPDTFYYTATVDSQELYQRGFNFGFVCKPGFDVGVNCIAQSTLWFHPNLTTTVYLNAGDMSAFYGMHCAAGVSGQVSMTFSGPISYVSPAPGALVPSSVTNTIITWNIADFGSINPLSAFGVVFITDTNAQNFAPVCFTANVLPFAGDNDPANNNYAYCSEVILAWDPNGKEVYPTGQLDSTQSWLTYTIHFKNTGQAPASNIYVLDTLDTNLDVNTFKLLGFNHQNVTQVLPGGVVKFSFPFINLPDSISNDSASTGYIQYKIKLKNNLPGGTIIANSASIYFDYNAPVPTNTVFDTIASLITGLTGGFPEYNFSLWLYPNPAKDGVTVKVDNSGIGGILQLMDVTGRKITEFQISASEFRVNTSALSNGVYFIKATNNKGQSSLRRLMIEK